LKTILLFGAGKSTGVLVDYLKKRALQNGWQILIADENISLAREKAAGSPFISAVYINVSDETSRELLIQQAEVVISMLPPTLHFLVAQSCIKAGRHLLTASYLDENIRTLEDDIRSKGLLFLGEMGLDPGIDHMSAMRLIVGIRARGGSIHSFISHCGGLVAPESDDNPWHYKISWNPRNVVTAGKAGAIYKYQRKIVRSDYHSLFDPDRHIAIPGHGLLSWYPNRNSLDYLSLYRLDDASTFIRTTLRHPDFILGWKKIVELRLTDETGKHQTDNLSFRTFFQDHLSRMGLKDNFSLTDIENRLLSFLGFFEDTLIDKGLCSAADVLQIALEKKLTLAATDHDMVIMQHEIGYSIDGIQKKITSTLIVKGEDKMHTAMAKTVGLPLGIAAELILQKKIGLTGLHIPVVPEIYTLVLTRLSEEGIHFTESEQDIPMK